MTYQKNPDSLKDCTTGFDIADVLETRSSIEVNNAKTTEWRVRLRIEYGPHVTIHRGSLPGAWEYGRISPNGIEGGVEIDLIDTRYLERL